MPTKARKSSQKKSRAKQQKPKSSQYKYEPLQTPQSIRLLQLSRGERDDPLQCYLFEVRLDDFPSFEAVSYTWGDPDDRSLLSCNNKMVSVPRNLVEALRTLRRPNRLRILWADAVCVNQKDLEERAAQVALMADMFSGASKVLMWLGRGDPLLIRKALDYICCWLNVTSPWTAPQYYWNNEKTSKYNAKITSYKNLPNKTTLEALTHLYDRPYFRRGWVVQEVVLPDSIEAVCDEACIDYLSMQKFALAFLLEHGHVIDRRLEEAMEHVLLIAKLRSALHDTGDFMHFTEMMMKTGYQTFSDPKDHFYGLLGLQDLCREYPLFKADYTISVTECCKSAVATLLVEHGDIGILSLVRHRRDERLENETLPSWIPRLGKNTIESGFNYLYYECWQATSREAKISRHEDGTYDCIRIRGVRVSKVESLPISIPQFPEDMQMLVKGLQDRHGEFCVAWTISYGRSVEHRSMWPNESEGNRTHVATYREFLRLKDGYNENPFVDILEHSLGIYTLFETEDGRLGMGSFITQPGDQLVLLYGGRMPFVLRPVGSRWRLVGGCFVLDLMHSEPVKQSKYDDAHMAEDFDIF